MNNKIKKAELEKQLLVNWLCLPHKVSTRTKAESDYWASQFEEARKIAKRINNLLSEKQHGK